MIIIRFENGKNLANDNSNAVKNREDINTLSSEAAKINKDFAVTEYFPQYKVEQQMRRIEAKQRM